MVLKMEECIFCKIVDNEIHSFCVYEDADFKVIMDKFPAQKGHVLIIPKDHSTNIFDISDDAAAKIYPLAKKLSIAIKETLCADGINIVQNNGKAANQAVFHFHLHIIPRYVDDGVKLNTPTNYVTSDAEILEVADLIRNKLNS